METAPRAVLQRASANFFQAFGMPILSGRGFIATDQMDSEPVAEVAVEDAQTNEAEDPSSESN